MDIEKEEIIPWNIKFNGGESPDEPFIVDGIRFWIVGRNASHEFCAGTKDGKRYSLTVGEGRVEGEYYRRLEEVEDFTGYYGHF